MPYRSPARPTEEPEEPREPSFFARWLGRLRCWNGEHVWGEEVESLGLVKNFPYHIIITWTPAGFVHHVDLTTYEAWARWCKRCGARDTTLTRLSDQ